MKVYINPGHDLERDSGAINPNSGLRECEVAADVGGMVARYLEAAGCEVMVLQSDNLAGETPELPCVVDEANEWPADIFISLHCNAANRAARGTEVEVYNLDSEAAALGECIQAQIVDSVGTADRGLRERPHLIVLNSTDMPAVLVEMAFIDNDEDAALLTDHMDDFARAIARGVTDYELEASK